MKSPLLLGTLLTSLSLHAADSPALKLVAEVKGFSSPESVASDGTRYYVSNVGKELKPSDKDGDGFISRMDAKGGDLDLKFIDGLNAPKGMLVRDGILFVCDVDVLLGFDLATKRKTVEVSFAKDGVKFLNDVCAAKDGKLIVSATDVNQLYLVDPKAGTAAKIVCDKQPAGPNGLAWATAEGDDYILVAEWGSDNQPNGTIRCYELDETLLKATEEEPDDDFPVRKGYQDGVAVLTKDGEPVGFLHSDWVDFKPGGKLYLTLLREEKDGHLALDIPNAPIAGPADFLYDAKTGALALPCMIEGRVLLLSLTLPEE